ncbi:MAG: BTAD domain-containing putative transcriptional regulator [Dehalococcoidia bacterium]
MATWMPVPRPADASHLTGIVALRALHAVEASEAAEAAVRAPVIAYTVAPGEDLWGIAQRLYGDGARYVDLFRAHEGRVMAGGERFTDPRVIRTGWTLHAPLPASNISVDAGHVTYRVTRGDHLWGIAARFLGDGFRWDEIWAANRDRDMGGGWRFTDPQLIYPGWELVLPVEAMEEPTSDVAPPAAAPGTASDTAAVNDEAGRHPADADADGGLGGEMAWDWPSVPRPVVLSAAGFAVLGAAALFVHRIQRTGRLGVPSLLQRGARRTGDAGRVVLMARAVVEALEAAGFGRARLVLAHEAARELSFTIDCTDIDGEAFAATSDQLAGRLGCAIETTVIGARQVELMLTGTGTPAIQQGAAAAAGRALMLPVGTDDAGRIVYVNLAGAGSMAIAGSEIEHRQLLHAWLETLATTAGADELALRADASVAALVGDDIDLPHFGGAENPDSGALFEEMEDAIQSREGQLAPRPLVAVFDAGAAGSACESLLPYGPRAGIYFVGLTDGEPSTLFGATVRLGLEEDDVVEDARAAGASGVLLTLGSGERIALDPVVVRRDESARWREPIAPARRWTPPPSPRDPEPPGEPPPPSGDVIGAFDWRRAIFEADDLPVTDAIERGGPAVVEPGTDEAATELDERERVPVTAAVATAERPDVATPVAATERSTEPNGGETNPELVPSPAPGGDEAACDLTATVQLPPSREPLAAPVRQQALFLPEATGAGPADEDEALIYVRCLGELRITVGGVAAQGWPYDKARELLALLVAHGGAPVPRKTIAESLWPDMLWDASLKHMLANATSALRSVVRAAAGRSDLQPLTLSHERYQVPAGMLRSDLDEFEEALRFAAALPPGDAIAQYERALALYEADFLEVESFAWLDTYREEYRQRFVAGALAAAQLAMDAGDVERAAGFYLAATQRIPTNEDAICGLMRCYAAVGNTAGVLKVYRVLTEAMQRELGPRIGPAQETRALLKELTSGAAIG